MAEPTTWTADVQDLTKEDVPNQTGEISKKPANRPTRTQLLFDFDMQREVPQSRQYFLPDRYSPSLKALQDLNPIAIVDLELETHHRGKVLFIRTIDDSVRSAAVQTIVEDESGTAERLALYNTDATLQADEVLPSDAIFAIKEPYYVLSPNGGFTLRIDHPSDLVRLLPVHPLIPKGLQSKENDNSQKSALDWKDEGNASFKAKDHRAALRTYSQALEVCNDEEEDLKRIVLRNRALVNIGLNRYEAALADAMEAVIPKDGLKNDSDLSVNARSYYRAGRAAYELGRLQEAQSMFRKVLEIEPLNQDASTEDKRSSERWKEQSTGDYDFPNMSKSASKKRNRLDYASFTSKTEAREARSHGRGLFAREAIPAGHLILCEKALSVSFDSDSDGSQSYSILNQAAKRQAAGTQATLLFKLVDKLLHTPELAAQFFDLDDGGYTPRTAIEAIDGLVPVDTFRVQAIVDHNSFGCPTVRSSSQAAQKQISSGDGYPSTGLWLRASYINHACDGNAMRSFIGDMMILRATKDIAKGDEILMPYRLPNVDNNVTQGELEKIWGFKCDCGLCKAEEATPFRQRKERLQLVEKVRGIMSSTPSLKSVPDNKTISHIERLYGQIEKTYNSETFQDRPRVGLATVSKWLCQTYSIGGAPPDKIIQSAIALLRDMGLIVTITGEGLRIDRTYCQMEGTAVEAAMCAASAFFKRGNNGSGKHMEDFAKEFYLIMNGEMRGFEEAHAHS